MLLNSLSPVMGADWTRNLSRHLASGGGSCFMACSSTDSGQRPGMNKYIFSWGIPVTSKSAPGSMRPALGRTQYLDGHGQTGLEHIVAGSRSPYCFGAVVLTLFKLAKAIPQDREVIPTYLEGNGCLVRVLDGKCLRHLVGKRTYDPCQ